jgi:hypothetical protein
MKQRATPAGQLERLEAYAEELKMALCHQIKYCSNGTVHALARAVLDDNLPCDVAMGDAAVADAALAKKPGDAEMIRYSIHWNDQEEVVDTQGAWVKYEDAALVEAYAAPFVGLLKHSAKLLRMGRHADNLALANEIDAALAKNPNERDMKHATPNAEFDYDQETIKAREV